MGTVTDALNQDLDEVTAKAIALLDSASEDLVAWCDTVRDPEMPWAFRWAKESLRPANVAACNYILQATSWCGVTDRVLTPEQKAQGVAWIHSLQDEGADTYTDPALVGRKPPAWNDAEENWLPDGAHKEANNQYARGCLRFYEGLKLDQLMGPTPPSWPQKGDSDVLEWMQSVRNWSWIGRMFHRLLPWYHEGAIPREVLQDCYDWALSQQDPETGFWGRGIQATFKLLIPFHDPAEMPVPRADKIIDSVLRVMDKPTYDDRLFPCEEFDAFYDLAIAATSAPGYREEEIKKVAAHRINYVLESYRQPDRGLSSYLDGCIPTWLKYDMAPKLPQGDAFGWGIFGYGINICVDILGIADQCAWTGRWRQREEYDTSVFVEVGKALSA